MTIECTFDDNDDILQRDWPSIPRVGESVYLRRRGYRTVLSVTWTEQDGGVPPVVNVLLSAPEEK